MQRNHNYRSKVPKLKLNLERPFLPINHLSNSPSTMMKDQRDRDRQRIIPNKPEKKVFILNCAAQLKLIIIILFFLCSLITLLLFFPPQFSLPSCLSTTTSAVVTNTPTSVVTDTPSSPPRHPPDETLQNGAVKRSFTAIGTAAYNFILMSAYRGGPTSFAIMALSSKPLQVYGHPTYTCEYITDDATVAIAGYLYSFQDWGLSRVYSTVVINCTFPSLPASPVSDPSLGGRLLIHAHTNGGFDRDVNRTDTVEALIEPPGSWNLSYYLSPPKYDFLYCGSSLFGNLSPQRVREWIAYHVRLFGNQSHFVIHDAGGVHADVLEVLKPWMELGFVTLQDVREQERFDGFYHNQFVVLNDCLHRYRFDTKWMFFFDLDEYIYVPANSSIASAMDSLEEFTQIKIEQMPMSSQLCLIEDTRKATKKWGFEKLVYRDMKRQRKDRKYAVQPRNVFATGVHFSDYFQGKSTFKTEKLMTYFHYRGTIAQRREPCRRLIKENSITVNNNPYMLETNMRSLAPLVKRFELDTIGNRLQTTRQ